MIRLGYICAGLMMIGCLSAHGQDIFSAKSYLPGCKDYLHHEGNVFSGRCVGVVEGLGMLRDAHIFCAPEFATTDQFIRLIVLYIEDRPERTQEDFRLLALEALRQAFPCQK